MLDKKTRFAIQHKMKLIYSDILNKQYIDAYFEEGSDNASVLCVFNKLQSINDGSYSYKKTKEYAYLQNIFNFINLPDDKIKVTSLYKVTDMKNILKMHVLKDFYDVLVYQILEPNIKYVIVIGFDTAKIILDSYLSSMKIDRKIYKSKIDRIGITANLKNVYDFFGKKMIIIPEVTTIRTLNKDKKQELVDALKGV